MKKIIVITLGLATIALAISTFLSISKGGTSLVLELTPNPDNQTRASEEEILENCCAILLQRCNLTGAKATEIQPIKKVNQLNRIRVKLQGVSDTKRIEKLLTSSVDLGFCEVYTAPKVVPYMRSADAKLRTLLADDKEGKEMIEKEYPLSYLLQANSDSISQNATIGYARYKDTATINKYLNIPEVKAIFPNDLRFKWSAFSSDYGKKGEIFELFAIKVTEKDGKAPLTGDIIVDAQCEKDSYSGRECLSIVMNTAGSKRWAQMTRYNVGLPIAIVLNNQVYSAPTVTGEITGGRSQISGNFSKEQAQDMAYMLKSGSLPAQVKIIDTNVIPDNQWTFNMTLLIATVILGAAFIFMLVYTIKVK